MYTEQGLGIATRLADLGYAFLASMCSPAQKLQTPQGMSLVGFITHENSFPAHNFHCVMGYEGRASNHCWGFVLSVHSEALWEPSKGYLLRRCLCSGTFKRILEVSEQLRSKTTNRSRRNSTDPQDILRVSGAWNKEMRKQRSKHIFLIILQHLNMHLLHFDYSWRLTDWFIWNAF